jgi:hypothetical protein
VCCVESLLSFLSVNAVSVQASVFCESMHIGCTRKLSLENSMWFWVVEMKIGVF